MTPASVALAPGHARATLDRVKLVIPMLACAAVLAACDAGPEQDCNRVNEVLRAAYPSGDTGLRDERAFDKLRKLKLGDPEIAGAVKALVEDGSWTFYTPYAKEPEPGSALDRVRKLCPR
jgi:hypothetical protein